MNHGDMPMEELQQYMGSSPCPDDIDEFWDDSLAEMRAIAPEVKLIPSEFQVPFAECFDLYFTSVKGARIHSKYVRPKNPINSHPALLKFHGYGWNAGDWTDKLCYAAMGTAVVAMDCRGQGGLSQDSGNVKGHTLRGHVIRGLDDKPQNMLFRNIFLDTAQLASIIMSFPEVDASRVGATGESQGGALAIACAALEPRIKRLAPVHPFLSDYKRMWYMEKADEIIEYFRFFDPWHERENEVFTKLGYIDIQNIAKRIQSEVMMTTGLLDDVCPPSTQFAVYNKIISPKKMLLYHDYKHEYYPRLADKIFDFMREL